MTEITKLNKKEGVSVEELASQIGMMDAERLLRQLSEIGLNVSSVKDKVSEEAKQKLLSHLQQKHHHDTSQEKIVLRRVKKTSEKITVAGVHGATKNKTVVQVQVRKKQTFIRRQVEEETKTKLPEQAAHPTASEVQKLTAANQSSAEAPTKLEAQPETKPEVAVDALASNYVLEEEVIAPVDGSAETAEEKNVAKRKERTRTVEEEEAEGEKHKKKKKVRERTSPDDMRHFDALLARGADLSQVLNDEEELNEFSNKKAIKLRSHAHAKVKVQAFTKPTAKAVHEVEVPDCITLADLAQRMSVKAAEVIKAMMKMGMIATINQSLEQDVAILVVEEMGHKAKPVHADAVEEALKKSLAIEGEARPRPPVITIMGHVDHGKTTLLDYIRTTKVAAKEAGGITQHIGAYHVQIQKGTLTFLDTPGHAAFTAMRARGAKLTDIVVLVVAADDGVMPQTVEAIEHAKAANVPIVVAVNKMDKPNLDPDRIKTELSNHGLIPEEWGGDCMFIPISAKTGMGVDQLLDSILVQAEVLELKAVEDCPARGVVIESRLDRGRGAVMSVLVQQGTLKRGDIILAGFEYGRIRALFDESGKTIEHAGPSIPVEVLGLSNVPQAGDDFIIVSDEKQAREVASFRQAKFRESRLVRQAPKLEDLLQRIQEEKAGTTLNLIIKADVLGSVEALKQALLELSTAEVRINIISSNIGGINESDANLAIASKAIIIAFNVRATAEARKLLETNNVDVHYYNIIYDVINEVKKAISGALAPVIQERMVGLAQVREVYHSSKSGAVAGCMVTEGLVKRNLPVRVLRDNIVIFEGNLESLRRFKDDVSEVRTGMECGIGVKNYNDIKKGDQIEVFERVEVKREI